MTTVSSTTIFYTFVALIAFAGNSVLCRLALGEQTIDAASFTSVRLLSGFVILAIIISVQGKKKAVKAAQVSAYQNLKAPLMLFIYALTFSYAYISLETGVGALILLAAVQITMILSNLLRGNKLCLAEWAGLSLAFFGFIYLVYPNLSSPSLLGFILMTIAGITWAIYTLQGRMSQHPKTNTAGNFIRAVPMVLLFWFVIHHGAIDKIAIDNMGLIYALISGIITSAAGYIIWYAVLPSLKASEAAIIQLCVPVLVSFSGVIFLNEIITLRVAIASLTIISGTLLVLTFTRTNKAK